MSAPAQSVVVTGVSSGIGLAIALALAAAGFRVFGSVRSSADATRFETALAGAGRALIFDVADPAAILAAAKLVRSELGGAGLAGLVNNAGIAIAGPLEHLPVARFREQFEVNVTGVLATTQAFLPLLKPRGPNGRPGRIVNISSVAGVVPMPFTGAYAASKAALAALTESLRRELMIPGVGVSLVVPASIRTPMWDKGDAEDMQPYSATANAGALRTFKQVALETGRAGLPPERVATAVVNALVARRAPTRVLVSATPVTNFVMRLLPRRLLDSMIAKRLGFPSAG